MEKTLIQQQILKRCLRQIYIWGKNDIRMSILLSLYYVRKRLELNTLCSLWKLSGKIILHLMLMQDWDSKKSTPNVLHPRGRYKGKRTTAYEHGVNQLNNLFKIAQWKCHYLRLNELDIHIKYEFGHEWVGGSGLVAAWKSNSSSVFNVIRFPVKSRISSCNGK